MRTSGKSLNARSALTSFNVTGRFNFLIGAMSTTADLPERTISRDDETGMKG